MAKTRIYKYPEFIKAKKYWQLNGKRYFLELEFEKRRSESIVVILKNPSKATDEYSDHTVNRVSNYIYQNRDNYDVLRNVGKVIILNLTPFYETYSHKLKDLTETLIEKLNLATLEEYLIAYKTVILAWGDHPANFYDDYQILKKNVFEILKRNKNDVYYVDSMSNQENPKHGQVWGYDDELIRHP